MEYIVITNNPLVNNEIDGAVYDGNASFVDILTAVRDKVHLGHRLLTHPLSGSVKPGQTPYKSVVITAGSEETTDYESVKLIEDALAVAGTLVDTVHPEAWGKKTLSTGKKPGACGAVSRSETADRDFQLIDYNLIAYIIQRRNANVASL